MAARLPTLLATGAATSWPSGRVKATVRPSGSTDSIVTRWVVVSLNANPARGTAWTWADACRSGSVVATASPPANRQTPAPPSTTAPKSETPAAHFIERIVIGLYLAKPLTRRTIAIRTGGATSKPDLQD